MATSLVVGQVENVELTYQVPGGSPITGTGITFREWSTGSARYWTGSAWTSTPTSLALTSGRYLLTVPALWQGLVVEAIVAFAAYPDLTDELVVPTPSTATVTPDVRAT